MEKRTPELHKGTDRSIGIEARKAQLARRQIPKPLPRTSAKPFEESKYYLNRPSIKEESKKEPLVPQEAQIEYLRKKENEQRKVIAQLRGEVSRQKEAIKKLRTENEAMEAVIRTQRRRRETREDLETYNMAVSGEELRRLEEEFEQMQIAMLLNGGENVNINALMRNPDDMDYEELLRLGEEIGHVNVGLSEEQISSIPVVPIEEEQSCSICLSDMSIGSPCKAIPSCKHLYHPECIDNWLKNKKTCPLCLSEALE